jgi:hypothetical protein
MAAMGVTSVSTVTSFYRRLSTVWTSSCGSVTRISAMANRVVEVTDAGQRHGGEHGDAPFPPSL